MGNSFFVWEAERQTDREIMTYSNLWTWTMTSNWKEYILNLLCFPIFSLINVTYCFNIKMLTHYYIYWQSTAATTSMAVHQGTLWCQTTSILCSLWLELADTGVQGCVQSRSGCGRLLSLIELATVSSCFSNRYHLSDLVRVGAGQLEDLGGGQKTKFSS